MARNIDGKIVKDSRDINVTFKTVYSMLYFSEVILERNAYPTFSTELGLTYSNSER